jgi:hypothetical protein
MITYGNNFAMQQYVGRIKEAGKIVRSAKVDIFGVSEESFKSTEDAAIVVETKYYWAFSELSRKLSKRVSNQACDMIISVVNLAINNPELINDIENSIQNAMKTC